jgi:hypothetical protein
MNVNSSVETHIERNDQQVRKAPRPRLACEAVRSLSLLSQESFLSILRLSAKLKAADGKTGARAYQASVFLIFSLEIQKSNNLALYILVYRTAPCP